MKGLIATGLAVLALGGCATTQTSDPIFYSDETLTLTTDSGRAIPLRVLTPDGCTDCAMIVFSHGANAAFDRYDALVLPFAQAGYRVAIPNHTDSEDHPARGSFTQTDWTPTRVEDVEAIISAYPAQTLIAAGHSYGALIAQMAGGALIPMAPQFSEGVRPAAILAYSPPGDVPGIFPAESWNSVAAPMLVTTGTNDIVPMMAETWDKHLASYEAAPEGLSYALIYQDMDHYMNGAIGRETPMDTPDRIQAMDHMIRTSLDFVKAVEADVAPASSWTDRTDDFVEMKAR